MWPSRVAAGLRCLHRWIFRLSVSRRLLRLHLSRPLAQARVLNHLAYHKRTGRRTSVRVRHSVIKVFYRTCPLLRPAGARALPHREGNFFLDHCSRVLPRVQGVCIAALYHLCALRWAIMSCRGPKVSASQHLFCGRKQRRVASGPPRRGRVPHLHGVSRWAPASQTRFQRCLRRRQPHLHSVLRPVPHEGAYLIIRRVAPGCCSRIANPKVFVSQTTSLSRRVTPGPSRRVRVPHLLGSYR